MPALFEKHQHRLEQAIKTCQNRNYWSPFQESPARKHHPPDAKQKAFEQFNSYLNTSFPMLLPGTETLCGREQSPYTTEPLGIKYPHVNISKLYTSMHRAWKEWKGESVETRIGACMALLEHWDNNNFLNAFATMHTAGQPFVMSFAGSGANALDRGLEAVAHAYLAQNQIPKNADFTRRFGRSEPILIKKQYRLVPRGIAVVICCGTFPTWNAYPAILANLATGNPVVVKPHPNGILPMAIAVNTARSLFFDLGFDPNLITMVADEPDTPRTLELLQNPDTKIIDFTGSPSFGSWIENNCRHALVFTETAGCNSVLLESTNDLDGCLNAVAQSLCLFSAQMCTSAQNIFLPADGMLVNKTQVSFDDVANMLVEKIDTMTADPHHAAALCGAVMAKRTLDEIKNLETNYPDKVLRKSSSYIHPTFPNAQTATPCVLQLRQSDSDLYHQEHFGPMSFLIKSPNRAQALKQATSDAALYGSISAYAYSTDTEFLEDIQEAYIDAGASVGCNLIKHLPINFSAAYSDYHVSGLNPAGNACLTDMAFVANRFRIVQSKTELSTP